MFRKSFIIKKENLFNWVSSEKVSRVEIANCYNKTLKDKTLCKIYVYFRLHPEEFHAIFGKIAQNLEIVTPQDRNYIKGLLGLKGDGFVAEKHIIKLREIAKRNKVDFNISNHIISFLNFKESQL